MTEPLRTSTNPSPMLFAHLHQPLIQQSMFAVSQTQLRLPKLPRHRSWVSTMTQQPTDRSNRSPRSTQACQCSSPARRCPDRGRQRAYSRKGTVLHIYHPPQQDDILRPPPPPEPALASQSAIFAPFREGASIAVKRHVRTWSAATGPLTPPRQR